MRIGLPGGTLDTDRRMISTATGDHPLREKEARIIEVLVQHHGEVVSREALLNKIFGYNKASRTRTLVTTIARTRQALEQAGLSASLLQTVYGEGYRWLGPEATVEHAEVDRGEFIGREAETARILALVEDPRVRLVSLVGTGGIGKSTLARELLASRDGACFVELAGIRTRRGLRQAVGRAMGMGGDTEHFALVHRGIRLLIFDNVEQVIEPVSHSVRAWLSQVEGLQIWCTGRRALEMEGEVVVPVGPLSVVDGRALFRALFRARSMQTEVQDDTLDSLVATLEGHPLSIELAAARCAVYSVPELQRRLTQQEPSVLGGGERVARSLELLDDGPREALFQLAAVEGAPTLRRLEDVLAGPNSVGPNSVGAMLQELLEHHLVRRVQGSPLRFRLHESVRRAVAEMGEPELVGGARDRWVSSVVRDAIRWEDGETVDTDDTELLDVLEILRESGDVARLTQLMQLAMDRCQRGHDPEALAEVIDWMGALSSCSRSTRAVASLGRLWRERLRDPDQAGAVADEAVRDARLSRDDLLICRALELRAQVLATADRRKEVQQDLEEVAFRHRMANRGAGVAAVGLLKAAASLRWGVPDLTGSALDGVASEVLGGTFEQRFRYQQLRVAVLVELARWNELPSAAARLVALAEREGRDEHRAWAMLEQAFAVSATERPLAALPKFREAASLAGQAWLVVRLWCNAIGTLARERRWAEAETEMHEVVSKARLAGGRASRLAMFRAGWLARLRGDLPLARSLSGVEGKSVAHVPEVIGHPLMHAQAGDMDAALAAQRRVVRELGASRRVYEQRRAALLMAELLLGVGEYDAAAEQVEPLDSGEIQPYERPRLEAIRMAARAQPGPLPLAFDPLAELDNACWQALAYHRAGDVEAAERIAERVRLALLEDALPPTSELAWRLAVSTP